MAKKAKVVKEKSIEDRIWDSANKLRGNLTASEYQNVVIRGLEADLGDSWGDSRLESQRGRTSQYAKTCQAIAEEV